MKIHSLLPILITAALVCTACSSQAYASDASGDEGAVTTDAVDETSDDPSSDPENSHTSDSTDEDQTADKDEAYFDSLLEGEPDSFDDVAAAFSGDDGDLVLGRGSGGMGIRSRPSSDLESAESDLEQLNTGDNSSADDSDDELFFELSEFCDPDDVLEVIEARSNAIKHCYKRDLRETPGLAGRVSLNWTIELDGSVSNTIVSESTLEEPRTAACIIRQIQRMRFAEPDGGTCMVDYPFELSADAPHVRGAQELSPDGSQ